jgi:hypothetical protein
LPLESDHFAKADVRDDRFDAGNVIHHPGHFHAKERDDIIRCQQFFLVSAANASVNGAALNI